MNEATQLEVQAYLDGELSARQRRQVEARLAADAGARALLDALGATRRALAEGEPAPAVPETREFYWSRIQREIQRQESAGTRRAPSFVLTWWRRLLLPTAGLAVLALTFGVTGLHGLRPGGANVEVSFPDADVLTYRDHANGLTLVWLSYPGEDQGTDYEAAPSDTEEL